MKAYIVSEQVFFPLAKSNRQARPAWVDTYVKTFDTTSVVDGAMFTLG